MSSTKTERRIRATVQTQRRLQAEAEHAERCRGKKADAARETPPKTGAHAFPTEPVPAQHLKKGGLEADLRPAPQYLAPQYKGSGKLRGKVALITGGDSGIGRAVAVLFAREGARIALAYLNEHRDAKDTAKAIENEGGECLLLPGDVKAPADCRKAVKKTVKRFGALDVLVNNAAFQQHTGDLADLSEAHFDETLKTNVYGYFHMVKAALPHLRAGAAIINTGSETGLFGHSTLIDYATTKGAIHALTKSLASHLLPKGIRVNAVAPGPVWMPLNPADRRAEDLPDFGRKTDFKRPAQPEEISPAYVFLASAQCSSYITGIVLPIVGSVGA